MATVSQIRTAFKTRLDTVTSTPALNVYAKYPGQVIAPAAVVRRRRGPTAATLGTTATDYTIEVAVLTSLADDTLGQDKLDAFLSSGGAESIIAAVEANPNLGGVVDYVQFTEIGADQIFEFGGVAYLGAPIVFEVGAS